MKIEAIDLPARGVEDLRKVLNGLEVKLSDAKAQRDRILIDVRKASAAADMGDQRARFALGELNKNSAAAGRDIAHFISNAPPIFYTDRRSAELIKYGANAFLATKITFINEIADLCEKLGGDVQAVARGIGLDNRIGAIFLHAGPGFGGSCFPKDTVALVKTGQDHDSPLRIVEAVVAINDQRKRAMARKVTNALNRSPRGATIAVLGLAFRPNTDDMREAPAIALITGLQDMGAHIRAYDPAAMQQANLVLADVEYCQDAYSCAQGADALVIVTEWEQFRALDLCWMPQIRAFIRRMSRPSETRHSGHG